MASVIVESGPVDAEAAPRDVPRERWRDLLRVRRTYLDIHLPHDCRILVRFRKEAEEMYEACGFDSPDDLVRAAYALDPNEINAAVEWLNRVRPDKAISLTLVLNKNGGDRRSPKYQSSNTTLIRSSRRGWLAKLERDAPRSLEVAAELEAVKQGRSSAHAAAVRLGWRSKRHCRTCQCFND